MPLINLAFIKALSGSQLCNKNAQIPYKTFHNFLVQLFLNYYLYYIPTFIHWAVLNYYLQLM